MIEVDRDKVHDWHNDGLCNGHKDPELWWYEYEINEYKRKVQNVRIVKAVEICNRCPVKDLCLKQGMETKNLADGSVWGGMLTSERGRLAKKKFLTSTVHVGEERIRREVRSLVI